LRGPRSKPHAGRWIEKQHVAAVYEQEEDEGKKKRAGATHTIVNRILKGSASAFDLRTLSSTSDAVPKLNNPTNPRTQPRAIDVAGEELNTVPSMAPAAKAMPKLQSILQDHR
jgi:hypothetical protein